MCINSPLMEPSVSTEREHLCGFVICVPQISLVASFLAAVDILIYFNSKHMSVHLQMSSQWFMGKMGGEVMSGSWHLRAFVCLF